MRNPSALDIRDHFWERQSGRGSVSRVSGADHGLWKNSGLTLELFHDRLQRIDEVAHLRQLSEAMEQHQTCLELGVVDTNPRKECSILRVDVVPLDASCRRTLGCINRRGLDPVVERSDPHPDAQLCRTKAQPQLEQPRRALVAARPRLFRSSRGSRDQRSFPGLRAARRTTGRRHRPRRNRPGYAPSTPGRGGGARRSTPQRRVARWLSTRPHRVKSHRLVPQALLLRQSREKYVHPGRA